MDGREEFSRSRSFWAVLRRWGTSGTDQASEETADLLQHAMSARERAAFASTLERTMRLLDNVSIVDSEGIGYVGDAREAAVIRLLSQGRDCSQRARSAQLPVVVDTDGSELGLLEAVEQVLEGSTDGGLDRRADQPDPGTVEAYLAGDPDRARELAPLAMAGVDVACAAVEESTDLHSWLQQPNPDFIECHLFAWIDDPDRALVVRRRGTGISIWIHFDPVLVAENDSLDRGIDLVWTALESAAQRYKMPLPSRPAR